MLAAILLNLPDYQQRKDGGGTELVSRKSRSRENVLEAVGAIEELLEGDVLPKAVKPVKKLAKRVVEHVQAESFEFDEFNDLLRELSMLEFQLRQPNLEVGQDASALVLEHLAFVMAYMQEQEEEILLLLME